MSVLLTRRWGYFLLAGITCFAGLAQAATVTLTVGAGGAPVSTTFSLDIEAGPDGTAAFRGDEIQWLARAGEPRLPWAVLTALLPPDANPASVSCVLENANYEAVEGTWLVTPQGPQATRDRNGDEIVRWPTGVTITDGRDATIYSADASYPARQARVLGTGKMRKWQMAQVAVPLATYNPVTGAMSKLTQASLRVTYKNMTLTPAQQAEALRADPVGLPAMQRATLNAAQAAPAYGDNLAVPTDTTYTGYLIVTTAAIQSASTKLAAFVAHKQSKGFTVQVITESTWGGGTGDTAANNIRAWLQSHYVTNQIKYVLFIGDPTPGTSAVPMKLCFSGGEAAGEPSDFFYSDLTGNWDLSGDGIYGQPADIGTGGIDGYWEVIVGRIPYYGTMSDVDKILQKTINYENAADQSWRRRVLLAENPMDSGTSSFQLGEQIKDNLLAPKAMPCFRVYGENYTAWPPPDLTPVSIPGVTHAWSTTPFGLVPWLSHGWTGGAAQMDTDHAPYLNDNYPSTTFEASCDNSYAEDSYNVSWALLKNGGIATIGATRVSWYSPGEKNFVGSPTIGGMAYEYANRIVQGMTPGEALADERQALMPGNWWSNEIVFNLWGDPSVQIMPAAPTELTVCGAEGCYSMGSPGGPFAWSSKTYTLKNPYSTTMNYTAAKTASWLNLSSASGSISAGSLTTFQVSLNTAAANALPEGTYTDTITFTDTTHSKVVTRTATLDVQPKRMVGYWKFDEAAGTTACDSSGFCRSAALVGGLAFGANSVPGPSTAFGNALNFDGVDDCVTLPSLRMCRNNATFTAWLKRNGTQPGDAGIIWSRSNPSTAGFHFNSSGDSLRYTWEGNRRGAGMTVPDNTWVFAALVITPTSGTIHMYNTANAQWTSNTVNATQGLQYFGGVDATYVGRDPGDASRWFKGAIDEVRIYDYAMDLDSIKIVALSGGKATNPLPAQGCATVLAGAGLWWTPGAAATAHDVYFGASASAVLNATTASGEYCGRQVASSYRPATTSTTTYYWRVDEVVGTQVVAKGDVWSFTTASTPVESGQKFRGTMDTAQISGTTLINAAGLPGLNARIYGNPANPAGLIGQALAFDGVDDDVRIPPMNMNSNTVTFTAWVNSAAPQTGWNAILFCRDGSTCVGLNVGDANELRYHWNCDGGTYGNNSGLVLPNNQWVLTALVVEPDRATIYMGTGGRVASWTNYYWHDAEPFDGYTYIGWDQCDNARHFKGSVDDVGIWNRSLTPAEIQAIYDAGASGASLTSKIVTDVASVTVPEGGTAPFRVKLDHQPTGNITVTVARDSGSDTITVQSGASLVFTLSNWSTYQTVTLASAWDPNLIADTAVIRCSAQGLADVDVAITQHDTAGGDFDRDSDVDLDDFGHLQRCLTGHGIAVTDSTCLDADLNSDTYVDQSDVTLFINYFNGAGRPPKTP